MSIGVKVSIDAWRGAAGTAIDAQAQAHYNRVIADGGLIPKGLSGCSAYFTAVKAIYATSDITTAIAAAYDPDYLGYKVGAGSGTTLGQAAGTLYSATGASSDLTQATAANQPLLLVHDGVNNYWWGSGVSGNYCSTPDAAANRITGDIEIIAKITLLDTTNDNAIIGKYQGGASTDWLFYTQGKRLKDITVGAIHTSTVDLPYNIGDTFYVKFTRIASTGDIEYFYKTNLTDSWTKLGATVSSTAGNLTAGSATVTVGAYSLGAGFPALTKIYRATISNSIGGAPVVNFDANEFNAATSQSSWTSSTGEVWSIQKDQLNNSAFSGQMVNRTIIVGSGTTYMTGDVGLREIGRAHV